MVVQYDKDLLEVWDEAKRLRCEWFNDYEKTASKPPMVIADLDVVQLDFRGKAFNRRFYLFSVLNLFGSLLLLYICSVINLFCSLVLLYICSVLPYIFL